MTAAMPSAAERSRTIVSVADSLSVRWNGGRVDVFDLDSDRSGRPHLFVGRGHQLARVVLARPAHVLAVIVELTDICPVAVRDRVRARLRIAGWLTPAPAATVASETGVRRAAEDDLVLRLDLARVALADSTGTTEVGLDDYVLAVPDPLARHEDALLLHLLSRRRAFDTLARLLDRRVVQNCVSILPVAFDRHGVIVRVEHDRRSIDVRLAFADPVTDTAGAVSALDALLAASSRAPCRRARYS